MRALPSGARGSTDWPDHGFYPARDAWPGGHRYGLRRERYPRAYAWSDKDRELAARHGIDLPSGLGMVEVTTWWDQPRRTTFRVEVEGDLDWSADAVTETETATMRQSVVEARQYGCQEWEYDPLGAVRPIRVVAIVGSPIRAVGA